MCARAHLLAQEEVHSLAKAWRESAVELAREMVIIEGIYPTHISLRQEEPAEVQEAAPKSPDADLPKLAKVGLPILPCARARAHSLLLLFCHFAFLDISC